MPVKGEMGRGQGCSPHFGVPWGHAMASGEEWQVPNKSWWLLGPVKRLWGEAFLEGGYSPCLAGRSSVTAQGGGDILGCHPGSLVQL